MIGWHVSLNSYYTCYLSHFIFLFPFPLTFLSLLCQDSTLPHFPSDQPSFLSFFSPFPSTFSQTFLSLCKIQIEMNKCLTMTINTYLKYFTVQFVEECPQNETKRKEIENKDVRSDWSAISCNKGFLVNNNVYYNVLTSWIAFDFMFTANSCSFSTINCCNGSFNLQEWHFH